MIVIALMQKPASNRQLKVKWSLGKSVKTEPKEDSLAERAWQRMLSGRRLDILNPSPLDIEIEAGAPPKAFNMAQTMKLTLNPYAEGLTMKLMLNLCAKSLI